MKLSRTGFEENTRNSHKTWVQKALSLELTVVEMTLLTALLLMLSITTWDSIQGSNVADGKAVRLAKLSATQELLSQNK